MKTLSELLEEWKNRHCWMLTYAEEAFFAGDKLKEHHYATCIRQWDNAIKELEEVINRPKKENKKGNQYELFRKKS